MSIAESIWDMKYRLRGADGTPVDQTISDTFRRVAVHLASVEGNASPEWAEKFFRAMEDFSFIPAGRIIAGAGAGRNVTLSNCFTMGTIPDSMDGIFTHLREAALTMQAGGGIGYDFSTIRPNGAEVRGVGAGASGPLPFMDTWDAMCRTVMSAGSRRGAMMATLRCDHPDIEDFIMAKHDPLRLRMFNVSVLVTDAFMEAVGADAAWPLVHAKPPKSGSVATTADGLHIYRTVRARELWAAITRNTYSHAEPGVIFIDRVNRLDNMGYAGTIATTNPCGEEPMQPYESCLLGSINLARFVVDPFTDTVRMPLTRMKQVVGVAVRMMDNVVDANWYPLASQREMTLDRRRIGLGITGLADMLVMMGIRYGSPEAVQVAEATMEAITTAAYLTSVSLAREKGPFPAFSAEEYLSGDSFAATRLPQSVRDEIRRYGIRNALLTSIAPTGTISLFAGNVSSGMEPIFAPSYTRKVLQPDGSRSEEEVVDYAVALWQGGFGGAPPPQRLPPAYVDAQTLTPAEHVAMQGALQKWVDSSISKTINCPEDISFEDFQGVYQLAWDAGCKGCTTYRPNEVTGSILSVSPGQSEPARALAERPETLPGVVTKVKLGDHAIYATVTFSDGRPFELFLNTKNPEHQAWATALTRMVSAIFRRGGDVSFVAEELKAVFDPRGGGWWRGRYWPSEVAAIGQVIEDQLAQPVDTPPTGGRPTCPKCFSTRLKREAGCTTCLECGHSNCG